VNEYPYWWDTVPAPGNGREAGTREGAEVGLGKSDVGRRTFDVAVIGAGYTGLSAARHLAAAGAAVLVLEREHVGWGASSRNGGQVLTGLKIDPATLVARYGEPRARRLFDISLESIARLESMLARESIECEYEASGHVEAASKPSHFAAFRQDQAILARVFDHRVEIVSRRDQRAEVGSDAYHGLLVDERSRALNPARYVAGLAAAARRAGAVIVERTPAVRVARNGRRWTVATPDAGIDVADVLIATNGYTGAASPALQRRFVAVGSYIIATEPLDRRTADDILPRRRMAFDSKHFLHYFRLTGDNRLLFGGRAELTRPTPETARRAAAILQRDMVRLFPGLAKARIEFAWGGNVAFTRDQMPHAGRLEGMYYAGGYCGHGIAMATYLGELIARRLAGEPVEHPLVDGKGEPFAAIPLYYGRPWFLPVAGAYYKMRDWLP
jgi:glycine/D-amino acid oxidase-like deaminating enzyme